MSAYQTPVARGFTEDAPLAELATPEDTEVITDQNYGGLKVACERPPSRLYGAAEHRDRQAHLRHRAARPELPDHLVGGAHRRGGTVLAPGDQADPIQVIDARDMAQLDRRPRREVGQRRVQRGQPDAAVRLR